MKQFIAKFESQIQGTLSGFDRVVFRGSLRRLTHGEGMKMYLIRNGLLCKQFGDHVKKVSAELKEASLAPLLQQKLPVEYMRDSHRPTRTRSRAHAAKLAIRQGNVCALTCTELTPTFQHEKTGMAVRYRETKFECGHASNPFPGRFDTDKSPAWAGCMRLAIAFQGITLSPVRALRPFPDDPDAESHISRGNRHRITRDSIGLSWRPGAGSDTRSTSVRSLAQLTVQWPG